ncbi:tumor necrosis factor [Terrapene carolina triunguis]|uniref:tumor necrosis factor n=1 Tax=Terrapene triunguis TaxID=2587831 RepID=UPI00115661D6|nr:tumor necrosis factor [Terrapene carolina triunguis]
MCDLPAPPTGCSHGCSLLQDGRELPEEMPGALELLVPPVGRSPQGWFLQHLDQEEAPRERRSLSRGKRPRSKPVAAHYKVQLPKDPAGINSGPDGTIRGWEETLNATKPLNYNPASGEFDVLRKGLYYLYCQVHFNEGRTVYIKLDVVVDGVLALRCLEQFPPTSAGPQDPELHVCQVSGLLLLQPRSVLRLRTIRDVRLKAEPYLTFFGLFQVHWGVGVGARGSLPGLTLSCLLLVQGPGELESPLAVGVQAPVVWRRGKRGSEGKSRQQDQRQQHRKRSVLHLAPSHRSTNNEGDMTEIWWQPFLQQGPALEVSGPDVAVKQTGLYLVYSQVLFHDPTFTMGQVLWRASAGGPGQILLRCVQSMPREPEQAYNSCYSGGVFQLQRGDQLSLRVPRANASLDLSPHGTFLGLVRL